MYREVGEKKPARPRGLAAGNVDITTVEGTPSKIIEQIKFTPQVIQETLERYEAQIVQAPVEHAIVIAPTGEVYHMSGGVHSLPYSYFTQLKEQLVGAHVTHNHPLGAEENDHTFSDVDFNLFKFFNLTRLRGIDEKFIYELNLNVSDNELIGQDFSAVVVNAEDYHKAIMFKAMINGFGYWRRER